MSEPKRYTKYGKIMTNADGHDAHDGYYISTSDSAILEWRRDSEALKALVKYELGLLCKECDGCGKCNEHRTILTSPDLLKAIESAMKEGK